MTKLYTIFSCDPEDTFLVGIYIINTSELCYYFLSTPLIKGVLLMRVLNNKLEARTKAVIPDHQSLYSSSHNQKVSLARPAFIHPTHPPSSFSTFL